MWYKNNFFKYATGTILVIIIIYLIGQIDFFLDPFKKLLAILFLPMLISVLLYYLFRPMVRRLQKFKIPASLSILIVFVFFIGIFSFIGSYSGFIIVKQFEGLVDEFPKIIKSSQDTLNQFINNTKIGLMVRGKLETEIVGYFQKMVPYIGDSIVSAISAITNFVSVLLVVPFVLFYLLRDDKIFLEKTFKFVPKKYCRPIKEILIDTDSTLAVYIRGQAIIALILGGLTFIGYEIIGIKYAFVLSLFVVITAVIPIIGCIIGVLPAVLIGLSSSVYMAAKVIIVSIIVQQLEGNFISPNIIGKKLNIHPMTVILIFLVAASMYGFLGMLICVPTYAVLKVLIQGIDRIYKVYKTGDSTESGE